MGDYYDHSFYSMQRNGPTTLGQSPWSTTSSNLWMYKPAMTASAPSSVIMTSAFVPRQTMSEIAPNSRTIPEDSQSVNWYQKTKQALGAIPAIFETRSNKDKAPDLGRYSRWQPKILDPNPVVQYLSLPTKPVSFFQADRSENGPSSGPVTFKHHSADALNENQRISTAAAISSRGLPTQSNLTKSTASIGDPVGLPTRPITRTLGEYKAIPQATTGNVTTALREYDPIPQKTKGNVTNDLEECIVIPQSSKEELTRALGEYNAIPQKTRGNVTSAFEEYTAIPQSSAKEKVTTPSREYNAIPPAKADNNTKALTEYKAIPQTTADNANRALREYKAIPQTATDNRALREYNAIPQRTTENTTSVLKEYTPIPESTKENVAKPLRAYLKPRTLETTPNQDRPRYLKRTDIQDVPKQNKEYKNGFQKNEQELSSPDDLDEIYGKINPLMKGKGQEQLGSKLPSELGQGRRPDVGLERRPMGLRRTLVEVPENDLLGRRGEGRPASISNENQAVTDAFRFLDDFEE